MEKLSLREKLILGIVMLASAAFFALLIGKFGALGIYLVLAILVCSVLAYYIFRNPEFGYALIIFFLPFERIPSVNIGGFDFKINVILGAITLFAWILALAFNPKKYKVQPNALAIPLVFFILAMLLSLTQAYDFSRALSVLIFTVFTILFAVLSVNMVNTPESLRKMLFVLFLSGFLVGLFGLFQFGGDVIGLPRSVTLLKYGYNSVTFGFPRIQAFSMEPLYFANYLFLPLFIALALFFNRVNIFKDRFLSRWGMIILIVLLMINFVLTVARGGYLGFLLGFLIMAVLLFRKIFTAKNIITFIIAAAVVGYGTAFALSKGEFRATNEFIGHVLVRDFQKGESVQGRLVSFQHAINAYKKYPLMGIGVGNYGPWVLNYPAYRPNTGWPIVNNEYLEILAETGLIGIFTFGSILVVLIFRTFVALKYAKDLFLKTVLIGLFAACAAIFTQYSTFSTLYIIHIWVAIGLLVAVQNIILQNKVSKINAI